MYAEGAKATDPDCSGPLGTEELETNTSISATNG